MFKIPAHIQAAADAIVAANRGRFAGLVMDGNVVLDRLRAERDQQFAFIDQLTSEVEAAGRDMVDAERANVEAAHQRVTEIDAQIAPLEQFEALRETHSQSAARYSGTRPPADSGDGSGARSMGADGNRRAQVTEREHEYRNAGEFLADGYRAGARGDERALARLQSVGVDLRNGQMVRMESRAAEPHITTDEVAGLLPTPIVGQIMSDVDAARPFISSVGAMDLGGIPGKTFERPVVTQHVEVGKQSAEKAEVAHRQFTVDGVPFTKDTFGGWANVARQTIDFTSPAAWNALMIDFQEQYALETENAAADGFATAVTQTEELTTAAAGTPTLDELLAALYGAATKSYQGSGRLPDMIWASLDWWGKLGVLIDKLKAENAGNGGGDSSLDSFAGNLLRVPRVIVPSFPAGTLIVGVRSRTEVYEDRFGFLTAVEPKVLGVEIAYGGYMASGTVKPTAFTKIVNAV